MKKLITAALLLLVWVGSAMGHYLTVDEQSTYIDVACDGFVLRFNDNTDQFAGFPTIYNPAISTYYGGYFHKYYDGSTFYYDFQAYGKTFNLVERTPTRVHIKTSIPLTGDVTIKSEYYIYSDHVFISDSWVVSSALTLGDVSDEYGMMQISYRNTTNIFYIIENSGSESQGLSSGPLRTWDDYGGTLTDQHNIWMSVLSVDAGTGTLIKNNRYATPYVHWPSGTLGVGTHCMNIMSVIDTSFRSDLTSKTTWSDTDYAVGDLVENDSIGYECISAVTSGNSGVTEPGTGSGWTTYWIQCHKYNSTARLEMGDQWKDTTIADPTTGTWVDDLVIPANVGVDGFASDGALHVEPTSKEAEFTNDITRHKQAIAFEDPHIYTGDTVSGATDHLVGYWPCDDNAASTTIVASVGSNGTLQGGDNTEDKDNADAVRGTSLLLNGTPDYIDLSAAISDLADTDKFTISFDFKPNFAYDGSVQYIFYVGSSTSNNVYIRYRSIGDYYQISREIGGTPNSATAITDAFTSNEKLQQWTHFDVAIDLDNDMISVAINGAIVGVWNDSTAAWSATPTALWLGHFQSSAYCAGYFDNVALYDGALLPYGAYFTGNGSVDTDVAHDDITCFVKGDESNSDSLKIGTGTITVTNATHATGPDGVADSAFQVDANGEVVSFPGTEDTNVDFSQGSFSFWYKETGTIGSWGILFACTDSTSPSDNEFSFQRGTSDPDLYLKINSLDKNNTSMPNIFDGNWHFLAGRWSVAGDYAYVSVDGVEYELDSGSTYSGTPTISNSTFYIGSLGSANRHMGGAIYAFAITNNPNTPQIPTIMGKPVHVPLIEVE
jgi:hypothetical protein